MTESRTQGLFAELLEGARALEERPQLEAKVADAIAARDKAIATADFAEARAARFAEELDTLRATLATKEAELAQATFREKEAGDKLAVLVGAFKSVNREINETVELVAPEPKPEPPAPVVDLPGVYSEGGFVSNDYNEPTAVDAAADQSAPDPTLASTSGDGSSESVIPTEETHSPDYKPYADRPYWLKPDAFSWTLWVNLGGDPAPWLNSDGTEKGQVSLTP